MSHEAQCVACVRTLLPQPLQAFLALTHIKTFKNAAVYNIHDMRPPTEKLFAGCFLNAYLCHFFFFFFFFNGIILFDAEYLRCVLQCTLELVCLVPQVFFD
jgi:hypothetical protein